MNACKQKGFTLIEVCLVMLIFGVAVSSLMALFPVSLRQGTLAVSDSVVSAFGDSVMNSLAGVASSMQKEEDWKYWKDEDTFRKTIVKDVFIDTRGNNPKGDEQLHWVVKKNGKYTPKDEYEVDDYLGLSKKANNSKSGRINLRYRLEIEAVARKATDINGNTTVLEEPYGKRLYRVVLHVTDNPSMSVDNGTVFVTYLAYLGEVL